MMGAARLIPKSRVVRPAAASVSLSDRTNGQVPTWQERKRGDHAGARRVLVGILATISFALRWRC